MKCFNCSNDLSDLRPASKGAQIPLDGDMILCPKCGGILIVNHKATRNITEVEYKALHPEDKNDLYFAVRAIQAKHKQLVNATKSKLILPSWLKPQ